METRKVQLSGGTTYTISLPKQWAEDHGIETGTLLALNPNADGSLLVSAVEEGRKDTRVATVSVEGFEPNQTRRAVYALYVLGLDRLVLDVGSDPLESHVRTAQRLVRSLTGVEVLETRGSSVVLQNMMTANHISVRKSVIRLELIVDAMQQDAVTALLTDDDFALELIARDDEADKLFALVLRCFRRSFGDFEEVEKLELTRVDLFEYYHLARQLERIGDHAVKIATIAIEQSSPPEESFADRLRDSNRTARAIRDRATDVMLSDAPIDEAYGALARCDSLVEDVNDLDRCLYDWSDPAAAHAYGLVLDSLRRSAEYGTNIAELCVQRRYRSDEMPTDRTPHQH